MPIIYHKIFLKHYRKRIIPFVDVDRAFQKRLSIFLENPKHPLLRDHKLAGEKSQYRAFSVTGDIRVVYRQNNQTIILYDIGTHAQVY